MPHDIDIEIDEPSVVISDNPSIEILEIKRVPDEVLEYLPPAVESQDQCPESVDLCVCHPAAASAPSIDSELDAVEVNATEDIPAFSLITMGGKIADSSNTAHFNHVVGIVIEDFANGQVATAIIEGEIGNPDWSWPSDRKLWLNGTTLSLFPPSSGFSQLIAISRNSQSVFIRLQIPIKL